jgi:flavodoxin
MRIEIYYFSGTGNSLHVARELQKRLPDAALVPISASKGKGRQGRAPKPWGLSFLT